MKKILILVSLIIFTGCTKNIPEHEKTKDPVIEAAQAYYPIVPDKKPEKEPDYITTIGSGFGNSETEADINAATDALVEAAYILEENGDIFINKPEKLFEFMQGNNELIKDIKKITIKKVTDTFKSEIVAKIDKNELVSVLDEFNSTIIHVNNPEGVMNSIVADINDEDVKKERLIEKFGKLFGTVSNSVKVELLSLNYDHVRLSEKKVPEGKVPAVIKMKLYVDYSKYDSYAKEMIKIITKELGGKLLYEAPLIKVDQYGEPVSYVFSRKYPLNDRTYAIIVKKNGKYTMQVYSIGYKYIEFFNQAYESFSVIGDPDNMKLELTMLDKQKKIIYDDIIAPFVLQDGFGYKRTPEKGTYPVTYILNKSEKDRFNGRFYLNTNKGNVNGALLGRMNSGALSINYLKGRAKELYHKKEAITAPFIFSQIGGYRSVTDSVLLEYEGLLDVQDTKKVTSVNINVIESK